MIPSLTQSSNAQLKKSFAELVNLAWGCFSDKNRRLAYAILAHSFVYTDPLIWGAKKIYTQLDFNGQLYPTTDDLQFYVDIRDLINKVSLTAATFFTLNYSLPITPYLNLQKSSLNSLFGFVALTPAFFKLLSIIINKKSPQQNSVLTNLLEKLSDTLQFFFSLRLTLLCASQSKIMFCSTVLDSLLNTDVLFLAQYRLQNKYPSLQHVWKFLPSLYYLNLHKVLNETPFRMASYLSMNFTFRSFYQAFWSCDLTTFKGEYKKVMTLVTSCFSNRSFRRLDQPTTACNDVGFVADQLTSLSLNNNDWQKAEKSGKINPMILRFFNERLNTTGVNLLNLPSSNTFSKMLRFSIILSLLTGQLNK